MCFLPLVLEFFAIGFSCVIVSKGKEGVSTVRNMQAETEELTHVDSARRGTVPEDAGWPPLQFIRASTAAAGDGNGQYIPTSPAAVHIPVPEDSLLPATSLAAAVAADDQVRCRK
jgi:hypothetical protein